MKKNILCALAFFVLIVQSIYSQAQVPAAVYQITMDDKAGGSRVLKFGLDPSATDGIDIQFGESDVPPFPPAGVFEGRFLLPINDFNGTLGGYSDYRQGTLPFTGQKEFRLSYQTGLGSEIRVTWSFPPEVTGKLQDIVIGTLINVDMNGSGEYTVTQPSIFNKLKLFINFNNVTDVPTESIMVNDFNLEQNYPNPFNPSTKIKYSIPSSELVQIKVYDLIGNEVSTLVNEIQSAGNHEVIFNANKLGSGIYFYQLRVGSKTLTQKMTLLK